MFDSVIVVTDRKILDKQIKDTVKQFASVSAIVGHADRSGDLRDFLASGKKIIIGGQAIELRQNGTEGERHVVARVAVGDREDVEVVDLLAARLQVRQGAFERDAEADEARVRHQGGA